MELRIQRDWEFTRDVRSTATEGSKAVAPAGGDGPRGADPQAAVSVDVARRQVEAENLAAAGSRIRDPAVAVMLASQIRTQITASAQDAMRAQTSGVTPQALRQLVDAQDPDAAAETEP